MTSVLNVKITNVPNVPKIIRNALVVQLQAMVSLLIKPANFALMKNVCTVL
jgi:hypothetical protein